MNPAKDLTGMQFGKLTVIERAGSKIRSGKSNALWKCKCECGNIKLVITHDLKHGTKSCGCMEGNLKHGGCIGGISRLYGIYSQMKGRCYTESNKGYHYYGSRGITICDQWLGEHGFENFREWSLQNGYKENLSIDRIDVNGNYCPENCRWVTMKLQNYNRRTSHRFILDGEEYDMKTFSDKIGISEQLIQSRLDHGWSLEEIVSTPFGEKRSKE